MKGSERRPRSPARSETRSSARADRLLAAWQGWRSWTASACPQILLPNRQLPPWMTSTVRQRRRCRSGADRDLHDAVALVGEQVVGGLRNLSTFLRHRVQLV
jgi:hypothetical protein